MKKKISLYLCALFAVIFLNLLMLPVHADILSHGNYRQILSLKSFNVIRGMYEYDDENYSRLNEYVGKHIGTGTLTSDVSGKFKDKYYTFYEKQVFEDTELVHLEYSFEDELFFSMDLNEYQEKTIVLDKEINIAEKLGDFNEVFHFENVSIYMYIDGEPVFEVEDIERMKNYTFNYIYGTTYTYNPNYINQDLHAIVGYNNKLSISEILEDLNITDASETNTDIVNNTYDPITATLGEYSFTLVVWDSNKNVTIQKIYVDVVDVTPPSIKQIKPTRISYKDSYTKEDLYECFEIKGIGNITYSMNIKDYLLNKNIVGEYLSTITIQDESTYSTPITYEFTIQVVDDISPSIAYGRTFYTDYNTYYTKEDIKAYCSAYDEYDGDISDSIEIEDLDNYEENYNKLGSYKFLITASDSSGNTVTDTFSIVVQDLTSPTFTIEKHVVLTERGKPITKEQIISLFDRLGYNLDGTKISSDCFNLDSLDGEYDLDITLSDGTVEHNMITTNTNTNINFDTPTTKDNGINLVLVLSLSFGGLLLVISFIMGIIVYKKRH